MHDALDLAHDEAARVAFEDRDRVLEQAHDAEKMFGEREPNRSPTKGLRREWNVAPLVRPTLSTSGRPKNRQ